MSKKHKFKIENIVYEWPSQSITGSEVRGIGAGIPESMDLYVKISGQVGSLVENDEKIDLDQDGIEKFYCQESSSEAGIN